MKDKNGVTIKLGDMVRFKEDQYTYNLGVVSLIYHDGVIKANVIGGPKGNFRILRIEEKVEVITSLNQ